MTTLARSKTDVWIPLPPLSNFVSLFWLHEGYIQPHAFERVLPTGTMELVFSRQADGRIADCVVGARSECLVLSTSRPFSAIGVHFKPGGAFPFFRLPAGHLRNTTVALEELWGKNGRSISGQLWEADTPTARFRLLEGLLLERLNSQGACHPAVSYALGEFIRSDGRHGVASIVDEIGISSRRFVDIFNHEVGLTPKLFCRIRRLNRALRLIDQADHVDLIDLALSCGYFDQAHFNHDFQSFAGMSPSVYLRDRISRTHVATR